MAQINHLTFHLTQKDNMAHLYFIHSNFSKKSMVMFIVWEVKTKDVLGKAPKYNAPSVHFKIVTLKLGGTPCAMRNVILIITQDIEY